MMSVNQTVRLMEAVTSLGYSIEDFSDDDGGVMLTLQRSAEAVLEHAPVLSAVSAYDVLGKIQSVLALVDWIYRTLGENKTCLDEDEEAGLAHVLNTLRASIPTNIQGR